MTEWRFLRSWKDGELRERLEGLKALSRNFNLEVAGGEHAVGWRRQYSESVVASEPPGPLADDGPFSRLSVALRHYEFSDPRIVVAHFDAAEPFEGRRMLLEIKILGLRYLTGTIVGEVREGEAEGRDYFGFRYDTLEGHIESGWEWFLIRKDRSTGDIRFSIEARWRQGEFPNFWSRIGFHVFAGRMQKKWHRHAHQRMAVLSRYPLEELVRPGERISHEGPDILFDFQ